MIQQPDLSADRSVLIGGGAHVPEDNEFIDCGFTVRLRRLAADAGGHHRYTTCRITHTSGRCRHCDAAYGGDANDEHHAATDTNAPAAVAAGLDREH